MDQYSLICEFNNSVRLESSSDFIAISFSFYQDNYSGPRIWMKAKGCLKYISCYES